MTASSFTFVKIEKGVKQALEDFKEHDIQLLELTADERAATHRIACYLQKYFPDGHVDCEYNRKGTYPKKLNGVLARPDIIVHRRNTKENLLCIEAKKAGESLDDDRRKLCGFTNSDGEYKYQIGLLLILTLREPYEIKLEWYSDGHKI